MEKQLYTEKLPNYTHANRTHGIEFLYQEFIRLEQICRQYIRIFTWSHVLERKGPRYFAMRVFNKEKSTPTYTDN